METLGKLLKIILIVIGIVIFPVVLIFAWGAFTVISPFLVISAIILFPGIVIGLIVWLILRKR